MVKSKAAKATKKAVQKTSKARPLAKGKDNDTTHQSNQLPTSLQQSLLSIFNDACLTGSISDIEATLQEVKGHLYNRDFATAFGKAEYLRVYAARWSPSRALGYAQIFHDIQDFLLSPFEGSFGTNNRVDQNETQSFSSVSPLEESTSTHDLPDITAMRSKTITDDLVNLKIACLGGGAGAEIVGFAGWLKSLDSEPVSSKDKLPAVFTGSLDVTCIDIADWDDVIKDLHHDCTTPRKLPKYASVTAHASNIALISPEQLHVSFLQQDILEYSSAEVSNHFAEADLVTIMFTLNELYSASVAKSQRLLHNLTASMKAGALLLVVDSPGTYSSVTINGAERKYPMQWLLDHTLLDPPSKASGLPPVIFWEKLVSDDSRWFRLQKEMLKYPIELENMRYQIHLYRRCESSA